MHQIQRALLGSRFDFAVVCQVAFFLGMNSKELISPTLTMGQIQQEQDSHYMKDTSGVLYTDHFNAGCGQAVELIAGKMHDFGGSKLPPYSAQYCKMER